jgi:hypothetical protein
MTEHPNFRSHRRAFLATSLIGAAQWSFLPRISQGALQEDSSVFEGESLYDLYVPDESILSLPVGQWNSAKISVRECKIERWLNGSRVVMATVSDNLWKQKIAQSKFNDAEKFGENRCGRIMLTDHGSDVHYRNFQFTSFEPNC